MARAAVLIAAIQALLAGLSVIMAAWVFVPAGVIGLALLGGGAIAAGVTAPANARGWGAMAWISSLVIVSVFVAVGKGSFQPLDYYHATMAWLCAAVVLLAGHRMPAGAPKTPWKTLGTTWAFIGSLIWVAVSYLRDDFGLFHAGLLAVLIPLIACRLWFRLGSFGIQTVHTLILVVAGLPMVDLFVRADHRVDDYFETGKRYYSYEVAKKDPRAFLRWWNVVLDQIPAMGKDVYMKDPDGVLPFRLRPGGRGTFFQSAISINSRGFRGREIAEDKGDAYRIVTIGESTTYGFTLQPGDRPWPELLEELIRERLQPSRPVEVINAGVPSYTLRNNLDRLGSDILPLNPDLIICYHGFNSFDWLNEALPRVSGTPPPHRLRPLKILARFEYRLKLERFNRNRLSGLAAQPAPLSDPMESLFAEGYRELIETARTHGVRVVLGDFSMAVNRNSDAEVIAFYRAGFAAVYWQMEANMIHSAIVERIAGEHPDVSFVSTHPNLDGQHQNFIDLVHFTQEGRQQLAETFFAGIRESLEEDLSIAQDTGDQQPSGVTALRPASSPGPQDLSQ